MTPRAPALAEHLALLRDELDLDVAALVVRPTAGPGHRLMAAEGAAVPLRWQQDEPVVIAPAAVLDRLPALRQDVTITAVLRGERIALSSALTIPVAIGDRRGWLLAGVVGASSMRVSTALMGRVDELEHVLELERMRRERSIYRDISRGVARISRTLEAGAGEPAVLHAIVTAAHDLVGTDAAYASLPLSADSESFRMAAFVNVRTAAFRALEVRYGEGLGGLARARGRPVLVLDYGSDRRLKNAPVDITLREGFLVAASAPLKVDGETIGCLYIANRSGRRLSEYDIELLELFARHAASALQTAKTQEWGQEIARAQEREHIAYELHDTVLRSLLEIALEAETSQLERGDAGESLAAIARSARETLDFLRQALNREDPGVRSPRSLSSLASALGSSKALRPTKRQVRVRGPDQQLAPRVADCLFSVGREAIVNAELHSGGQDVDVELEGGEAEVHLTVRDFGHGFGQAEASRPHHYGLAGMHWRVSEVNGRLWFEKPPSGGFAVHVAVPMAA